MTVLQAITAELDEISVDQITIEKVLLDSGLNGATTYDKATHEKSVDMCVIDLLQKVLSRASISEGGYSIRYDAAAIRTRIAFLSNKHDLGSSGLSTVKRLVI